MFSSTVPWANNVGHTYDASKPQFPAQPLVARTASYHQPPRRMLVQAKQRNRKQGANKKKASVQRGVVGFKAGPSFIMEPGAGFPREKKIVKCKKSSRGGYAGSGS